MERRVKYYKFNLGNTGLLPVEEGLITFINAKLQHSTEKHNKTIRPEYVLKLYYIEVGKTVVKRTGRLYNEPIQIPLA